MYLMAETTPFASNENYDGTLACYDYWSSSPVKRWVAVLPDPSTSSNFIQGAPPFTDFNGFFYQSLDVVNGVAFCSELWGTVHGVDQNGNLIENISPGPEMSGMEGWEDENMGLRAP